MRYFIFISLVLSFGFLQASLPSKYRLSNNAVKAFSSVYDMNNLGEGDLITDNHQAFMKRVEMIDAAQESLELAYYIYSQDESSSVLTQKLLEAANRGVKVRLLLDYITNYKHLDWFNALSNAVNPDNGGSIEVRLYGRPSPNVIKDSIYLSSACSEKNQGAGREAECAREKDPIAEQIVGKKRSEARNYNTGFSGHLLSGMYGKSGTMMGFALTEGGKLDFSALSDEDGNEMTEEEKQQLVDLIKLIKEVKFGGSFKAAIKLQAAMLFYGEDVRRVVDTVNKYLPDGEVAYDDSRDEDWSHFTDFLHHKFLLQDNRVLLIGGRNIENSYHMEVNPSGKYVFLDTDAAFDVDQTSGKKLQDTFTRIWDFKEFVATIEDINEHAPNDMQAEVDNCVANSAELLKSTKTTEDAVKALCIGGAMQTLATPEGVAQAREARQAKALETMDQLAATYMSEYYPGEAQDLSMKIDAGAKVSYIENLPFTFEEPSKRTHGAMIGEEEKTGKYIHKLWVNALLDSCKVNEPKNVYLHQAYFVLPMNLVQAIAEMTKTLRVDSRDRRYRNQYQDLDCSNVTIKVITNSIATTDLSIINIFARHQMHALLKAMETTRSSNKKKAAKLEYYEYVKPESGVNKSLHTKVSVFPDKAIVGSANADIRSYMMDSNNGVLIENAPNFIANYAAMMESMISSGRLTRKDLEWRDYKTYEANDYAELNKESEQLLDAIGADARARGKKWGAKGRIEFMKGLVKGTAEDLRNSTKLASDFYVNIPDEVIRLLKVRQSSNRNAEAFLKELERTKLELQGTDKLFMPL